MQTIYVQRKQSAESVKSQQGQFFSLASSKGTEKDEVVGNNHNNNIDNNNIDPFWTVIDEDIKLVDADTNDVILIMKKNVIPKEHAKIAYERLMPVAKSNSNSNRGIAGGKLDIKKIFTTRPNFKVGKQTEFRVYPLLKNGNVGKTHYCNPVSSSIVGWTDIPKRTEKDVKCRLTAFTARHFEKFSETFPFFEKIDQVYEELAPEHRKRQKEYANNTVALISNTTFSTITVNHLFRSALHKDAGDYKDGLGAFSVWQSEKESGELLFPEFGIAARMCTGDVLLFNSHLWHCTAPIQSKERLTFVCYLRMNIPKNCPKSKDTSIDG